MAGAVQIGWPVSTMKNSARWGPDRDNNTILIRRIRKEGFLMVDHLGDTERIAGIRSEIKSLAAQRSLTLPVVSATASILSPFAMTDLLEGRNFGQQLVELE
jgi:NADPH-dependent curcumin reductase CurA